MPYTTTVRDAIKNRTSGYEDSFAAAMQDADFTQQLLMLGLMLNPRPSTIEDLTVTDDLTVQGTITGDTIVLAGGITASGESSFDSASVTAFTGNYVGKWATGSLTNAQMLALRATPVSAVDAPGAGFYHEVLSFQMFFDYTGAYTESDDNIGLLWGTAGTAAATIESTGFVDATADTASAAVVAAVSNLAKTAIDNKALVIHNTGSGELGGGNAANVMNYAIFYRTIPLGW